MIDNSMLSRYDRDALAGVINRYLGEEITAFEVDESISKILVTTNDDTVKEVGDLFWYHYDDIEDHKVVASKEEWDYFQRLLLILKSDAKIVTEKGNRRWTIRQAVAGICIILFGLVIIKTGFGSHLYCATAPLGILSMLLSHWRSFDERRRLRKLNAVIPFGSVSEILTVRHKVNKFIKIKYPTQLGSRRIRSPMSEVANWLHFFAALLFFSPVVLLFQTFPEREERCKVVL